MIYNYIEIGTSDHTTIYEKMPADKVGLSVEPIYHYIKNLRGVESPTKKRLCAAIVPVKTADTAPIYFVDENLYPEYTNGQYHWVRGSNSVFKPHPLVSQKLPAHVISTMDIPVMTWDEMFQKCNITGISETLKIDVEGLDNELVHAFLNCEFVQNNPQMLPKNIEWELWNWVEDTDPHLRANVEKLRALGYNVRKNVDSHEVSTIYATRA